MSKMVLIFLVLSIASFDNFGQQTFQKLIKGGKAQCVALISLIIL